MSAPAHIPEKYPHKWPMMSTNGLSLLSDLTGAIPHLRKLKTSTSTKTARITAVSMPRVLYHWESA